MHWLFDAFAVTEAGEMDLNRNLGGVRPGLDLANDLAAHRLHAANAAGSRPAQSGSARSADAGRVVSPTGVHPRCGAWSGRRDGRQAVAR